MASPTQQLTPSKRRDGSTGLMAPRDLANDNSLVVATHAAAGGRGDERDDGPFCVRDERRRRRSTARWGSRRRCATHGEVSAKYDES